MVSRCFNNSLPKSQLCLHVFCCSSASANFCFHLYSVFCHSFIFSIPSSRGCFHDASKVGGLDRGADELQRQQGQAGREGGGLLQQEEPSLLRSEVRHSCPCDMSCFRLPATTAGLVPVVCGVRLQSRRFAPVLVLVAVTSFAMSHLACFAGGVRTCMDIRFADVDNIFSMCSLVVPLLLILFVVLQLVELLLPDFMQTTSPPELVSMPA